MMLNKIAKCLPLVLLALSFSSVHADAPNASLSAAQQKEVIESLSKQLSSRYVFADVAKRVVTALDKKMKSGAYAKFTDAQAFSKVLDGDLRELGNDSHFMVAFDPNYKNPPDESNPVPTENEVQEMQKEMSQRAYGIQRVEQLQGNVGYIELRGFGPTYLVSDAYTAAITLLQGTDALIIDLRRNGGGEPASVAYFLSHFFPKGDIRHLNDMYSRKDNTTQQSWTSPSVAVRYTKPVYVLTAARTFSGGEECAYDFQTQKRATLVGETTGGGANAGDVWALAHGVVAFIPSLQAINPVTKTNWEHVGVKPDIAVPAEQALSVAHAAALKTILASSTDPEQKEVLNDLIPMVEKNELPPPNYKPRR